MIIGGCEAYPGVIGIFAGFADAAIVENGYSTALVSAGSRLRDLDPDMFAFYRARRDAGHR